ncbi:hypothetical protein DFQ30_001607, partial [Apophysomyces sp. BC1015]
ETGDTLVAPVPLDETVSPVATTVMPVQGIALSIDASMEMKTRMAVQHMQELYEAVHKAYINAMLEGAPVATIKSLGQASNEMAELLKQAKEAQMHWEEDKEFMTRLQQRATPAVTSRQQVVPHNLPKF